VSSSVIDFSLFAFSHCRGVVAAVTNAGGFGVLGATAYTPEQLDQELSRIDDYRCTRPADVAADPDSVGSAVNTRGKDFAPAPTGHHSTSPQVEMVHDFQAGDRLHYNATVCDVEVRTERLDVEWVDLRQVDHDGVGAGAVPRRGLAAPSGHDCLSKVSPGGLCGALELVEKIHQRAGNGRSERCRRCSPSSSCGGSGSATAGGRRGPTLPWKEAVKIDLGVILLFGAGTVIGSLSAKLGLA
jgi:hypothetical protein